MKICAITNCYNEQHNLPIWLQHYSKQLGPRSCFVIDHGSTDGSTDGLGDDVSVLKIPRSLFNDGVRANMVTDIARGLLREFDLVIYTDADELLVADPRKHATLRDFFEADQRDAYTAFGLNVVHRVDLEDALDLTQPILSQRRHVHFVSPMCKTSAVRKAVRWTGGFHGSTAAPSFGDLFLLHMRWADVGENLERLRTTRTIEWKRQNHVTYQKNSAATVLQSFLRFVEWPVIEDADFRFEQEVSKLLAGARIENDYHRLPPDVRPREMLRLPDWFPADII